MEKEMQQEPAGFAWFPTYTKAVQQLPDQVARMQLVYAFYQYSEFGTEPKFIDHHTENGIKYVSEHCPLFAVQAIFEANRVNLDNSRMHHENGMKGKAYGKLGGRPRKGETAAEAKVRRMAEAQEASDAYEPEQVPDDGYDYSPEPLNHDAYGYADLDVDISRDL